MLIYDKYGSDIISPLLTVKELRNLGVTLHLYVYHVTTHTHTQTEHIFKPVCILFHTSEYSTRQIDSAREQITDAVAVYFVMPTKENVDRICTDCKAQLYSAYYFNFITPITRSLLEDLAKMAVETRCVEQISKVCVCVCVLVCVKGGICV